jgi:hypothetical protein
MRISTRLLCTTSLIALFGTLSATPATALVINQNVNFAAVNKNPWTGGPAFEQQWNLTQPSVGPVRVDLPKLNGNPLNIIADFLGIDLPFSANVGAGGTVSGSVGFDFGYYVSGGKLNVNYPALSTLNIQTIEPDGNRVIAGRSFSIGSNFTPGLNTISPPLTPQYVAMAGLGYEVLTQNVSAGTTMKDPFLKTTFPYASVWADFNYDINGGAFVEATAKVFGACIVCARKEVKFGDGRTVTLLEIDPGGKGQPPVVRFLGNQVNPFQPIQIGPAKIEFSYPDVAVQGSLQGDRSVFGSDTKSIISVQGGAEKLIPFIGPFLQNGVGPFGYQLLSTDGGPSLGLYQDFRFTPKPEMQLAFSQPILQRGADGKYRPTNVVRFALGDTLDIIAPLTLGGADLRVQPTYFLNNTVYNQTGLSLGVQMDLEMLRLTSPFGSLGPAFRDHLDFELARMTLFENQFSLSLGAITGRAFELDVEFPLDLTFQDRFVFAGVVQDSEYPEGEGFRIIYIDTLTGEQFSDFAEGEILTLGEFGDFLQQIFIADEDVIGAGGINLGRAFCLVCVDISEYLFEEESPFLDLGDDLLFLSDLTVFDDGEIDITDHPILGMNNFKDEHRPVATEIGPTVFFEVPEPGTLAAFLAGLVGIGVARRRRATT